VEGLGDQWLDLLADILPNGSTNELLLATQLIVDAEKVKSLEGHAFLLWQSAFSSAGCDDFCSNPIEGFCKPVCLPRGKPESS
jgi:hypothetical protein